MRLIELRANQESFHTITFNRTGVSIIRAVKKNEDKRSTYNSTGKSLTIYLIHFCLGASESNELKEKLSLKYNKKDSEKLKRVYKSVKKMNHQA